MTFDNPNNAEEAAYAGFALFDSLTEFLLSKNIITRNDVKVILSVAIDRLEAGPNDVSRRAADAIRHPMLNEK